MKTKFLKLIPFIVLISACKVNVGSNESQQFKVVPLTAASDFQSLKTYVLGPNCSGCHSWANDEAQVQQRLSLGNAEGSILFQKVKTGEMPPSGSALTNRQLALVEKYINEAKKAAPTIPLEPTFKSINYNLVAVSCVTCHNNAGEAKNKHKPSFEGYDNIKKHADDMLDALDNGAATGDPMPPIDKNGQPKAPIPSQAVVEAFRTWINEGYQNN